MKIKISLQKKKKRSRDNSKDSNNNNNEKKNLNNNNNKDKKKPNKNLKRELCKYFLNGECKKGEKCTFSHIISDFACKYFHAYGKCDKKKECK